MIMIFNWEVLTKNDKDFATLERLAVDGGWLYRTTERANKFGDYRSIFAQQVTFVPAVKEIDYVPEVEVSCRPFLDSLKASKILEPSDADMAEIEDYINDNSWSYNDDGFLVDYDDNVIVSFNDCDIYTVKDVAGTFPTEDAAILAHKTKFGDL